MFRLVHLTPRLSTLLTTFPPKTHNGVSVTDSMRIPFKKRDKVASENPKTIAGKTVCDMTISTVGGSDNNNVVGLDMELVNSEFTE